MRIIHKDIKQGILKLRVDSGQDLWYLSSIIESGDRISGMTERKIKLGSGGADERSKVSRRSVFLKIIVEKIEHDSSLRVSGKIIEAPEDIPKGDYHTFDIIEGTIISIEKDYWTKYSLKKLDESTVNQLANVLIVAFDREEAIFAILKAQGYETLLDLKGDVSKKDMEEKKSNFYQEIYLQLMEYDKRFLFDNIVVASPAFWKEYLLKEVKDEKLKKKIILATCSSIDDGTISEILKRPELKTLLEKDRATRELRLVEELLGKISRDDAVYGFDEVREKLNSGNVQSLLVSENLIFKARRESKYNALEELMNAAESLNAELYIVSSEEAAKKLDGISGIAVIFRWKENYQ